MLLGHLERPLVLGLGRVPQPIGNGERGQSHHSERDPVQQMGREPFVVIGQTDDAAFSRLRADRQLDLQYE